MYQVHLVVELLCMNEFSAVIKEKIKRKKPCQVQTKCSLFLGLRDQMLPNIRFILDAQYSLKSKMTFFFSFTNYKSKGGLCLFIQHSFL